MKISLPKTQPRLCWGMFTKGVDKVFMEGHRLHRSVGALDPVIVRPDQSRAFRHESPVEQLGIIDLIAQQDIKADRQLPRHGYARLGCPSPKLMRQQFQWVTYSALRLLRPIAEAVWDPDLVLATDRIRPPNGSLLRYISMAHLVPLLECNQPSVTGRSGISSSSAGESSLGPRTLLVLLGRLDWRATLPTM